SYSSVVDMPRAYSLYVVRYLFLYCHSAPRGLHSFPTRRSSDLVEQPAGHVAGVRQRLAFRGWDEQRPGQPCCGRTPALEKGFPRSEEHTSELQSRENLVCRLLLEKKKTQYHRTQWVPHYIT